MTALGRVQSLRFALMRIVPLLAALAPLMPGSGAGNGAESPTSAAANLARGARYKLAPTPNYRYCTDPDDKIQLTDGQTTKGHFWTQKGTVGWNHVPYVTVTVDLGRVEPIGGVSFDTAAGAANVEWPAAVEILVSDDGQTYYHAGDLVALDHKQNGPWPKGYAIRRLVTQELQAHGRYVQFLVIPRAGCPYVFVDEVEVFRGPDALLQTTAQGRRVVDAKEFFQARRMGAAIEHRFEADAAAIEAGIRTAKLPTATQARLLERLASVRKDLDKDAATLSASGAFQAVLPFALPAEHVDAHARLFAIQADLWRTLGRDPFSAWVPAPLSAWVPATWDPVPLVAAAPQGPPGTIEVHTMRGEYRAAAVNLANSTAEELEIALRIEAAPGSAKSVAGSMTLHAVPWTDTSVGSPVAAALVEIPAIEGVARTRVRPGLVGQVWLTIHVTDLPPGDHRCTLVVEPQVGKTSASPLRVPIRLHVYPFDFPQQITLALGGWCYTDGKRGRGVTEANREAFLKHLEGHFVNCPWATAGVLMSCKFTAGKASQVELDTTRLDDWLAQWPRARQYRVFLSAGSTCGGAKIGTPEFDRRVAAWISAWVRHLAGKGITADRLALLVHDEPHETTDVAPLLAWARAIHAAEPKVVLWEDPTYHDPAKAPPELFAACQVLCPNRPMWLAGGKPFARFYLDQQRQGRTLELYSCSGPARLLDPYSYYRLQAWHCWQIGATGTSFWSFSDNGGSSSWNEYLAKAGPFTPLFLDDASVTAGKHMEAIRESVEDYEYFVMLRKALDRAKSAGRADRAVARAESLLASAAEEVLGAPDAQKLHWSEPKDRTRADAVRIELLQALTQLGGSP